MIERGRYSKSKSSIANSTPDTGLPNVAAMPAAAPATSSVLRSAAVVLMSCPSSDSNAPPVANSHQGYPVVDEAGLLDGVLTRRDLHQTELSKSQVLADVVRRPPKYVYDDCTVRQAADHMVNHNVGRLPVVSREAPHRLTGIVTRSDILSGYRRRLREGAMQEPSIQLFKGRNGRRHSESGKA
jgi:CBS domain-containing protein